MFRNLLIAVACVFLCGAPLLAHAADDLIPAELLEKAESDGIAAQAIICALYNNAEHSGKNEAEGFKWCTIAARRGSAESQYHLANMLLDGRGYQKDEALAAQWLMQAAMQGHAEAQLSLAKIYFDGTGVKKDVAEAYKWLLISIRLREDSSIPSGAEALKKEIEAQMTVEQQQEIQKRVPALPPAQ